MTPHRLRPPFTVRNVLVAVLLTGVLTPVTAAQAATQPNAPWNLDRIDQEKLPLNGTYNYPDSAGKDVTIYVVSTGIKISHNDFDNNRATWGVTLCDNCLDVDNNGSGTHLASIAGGKTWGVAKKPKLVAIKVGRADGNATLSDLIKGVEYAGRFHVAAGRNAMSVALIDDSRARSRALDDAVNGLVDAGVHVVVPAGDDFHGDACDVSPAAAERAITVGAIANTTPDTVFVPSNVGKCVDIFAPGSNIRAAHSGLLGVGTNSYTEVHSGSAQAAAHVAGAIALIISKHGNRTPAKMATTLTILATKDLLPSDDLAVINAPNNRSPNLILRVPTS